MKRVFCFLIIFFVSISAFAREYDYQSLVDRVKERFANSVKLYENGEKDEALEVAQSAYFELFENLEGPIRINVSGKKSWDMERKFTKIRNLIKNNASIAQIQETIDSLNADMDEVLPELEKGVVIVAEASDNAQTTGIGEAANNLDIRWQTLYNNIDEKFTLSIEAFKNNDKTKAKELARSALFDDYRNGRIEIAVRKYLSNDGRIQDNIRRAIISIDNLENASTLEENLNEIRGEIFEALSQLPSEAAEIAVANVDVPSDDEPSQDYFEVLANIKLEGEKAFELYKNGESKKAISVIQNAYFDIFEASGMEVRIGATNSALKLSIEGVFSEIVAIMKSGGDMQSVRASLEKLYAQVEQGANSLSTKSTPWSLFLYSLMIILREGVEALIVVAAVIAYLVKSGNENRLNIVYSSLWSAIALSFATAFVMNYLFQASGESRELLEGITMLVAVLLLFYVGFWLLSNAHAKKWSRYINEKVKDSIGSGSAKALWFTVFLAVYREGAETVLFYQAIIFDAKNAVGYGMIAIGLLVGSALLIALFFALKAGAVKIPIKPFFITTSIIIFYMSVTFAGKGVMELVEGKIIEPTMISNLPTITWLGFYPYVESLVPQIALILGIVAGTIFITARKAKEK
jgi:FTR1 family protein